MKKCISSKVRTGLAAAAIAGAAGSAALAQDAPIGSATEWQGFYAGIQLNATSFTVERADLDNQFNSNAPTQSANLFSGGIVAGYNYMLSDTFLIGGELEYNSRLENNTFFATNAAGTTGREYNDAFDNVISLRARGGVVNGATLAYITGGVSQAKANFQTVEIDTGAGKTECDNSRCAEWTDNVLGMVFGVGVEHEFRQNITGKLEFLSTQFESSQAPVTNSDGSSACAAGAVDTCTYTYTPRMMQFRIGVNYLF
ncbi:outer membrane protein [Oceanomicrobium pacificus]|uniref:Outer membrane beta-barrel protein n=1 Tax=Oceanomicrobium pacificus TaxID=2692916 RepID=A0A6B0TZ68_9RHOB|nr:outer membrane beta-barrel protein [Oceanomicrobium pacificus]MXU66708.1 outer membrane beta-barrel protein [Oceanomicrobium pacificus]